MAHYHVVCASSCGVFALLWCDCSRCKTAPGTVRDFSTLLPRAQAPGASTVRRHIYLAQITPVLVVVRARRTSQCPPLGYTSHCAYLLIFPNVRSFARISLPRCLREYSRVPRSALNFIFRVYARVIPPVLRVFRGVCAMCACGLSCILLQLVAGNKRANALVLRACGPRPPRIARSVIMYVCARVFCAGV